MAKLPSATNYLQQPNSSDSPRIAKILALARALSSKDSTLSSTYTKLESSNFIPRNIHNSNKVLVPTVQYNVTYSPYPKYEQTSSEFPVYIIAAITVSLFVMTTAFFYFLCRCLVKKKKRVNQLANLTPKIQDPRMTGVRANQPIQFVVPTTVAVSENTEDSVSETEYSSSGAKSLPMILDRRKRSGFQINPEELQHGLYVGVTAVSEKGTFLGDLGKVGFCLRYNLQRNQLTVRIIGAKDLPCHFMKTTANPCVKVVLLPDKTTKYVTKVQRNTTNPDFNEDFLFGVRRDELPNKKLKISVWDYDRFSRKCQIGQIVYSVKDSGITNTLSVDATSGEIWVNLNPECIMSHDGNGEILLSLCYEPDSATLTLTVLKVRHLNMQQDKGKDTSIYAKVTLYVRRKMVRTKKTPSRRKAPDVEFNSPFSIHVTQSALRDVDLTIVLCEKWPLGGKKVLGRTQAGSNCLCEQGLQHWQDMLASPKSTCAQWHALCG